MQYKKMMMKFVYSGMALKYYQVMNYQFRGCNPITKVTRKVLFAGMLTPTIPICSPACVSLLRGSNRMKCDREHINYRMIEKYTPCSQYNEPSIVHYPCEHMHE